MINVSSLKVNYWRKCPWNNENYRTNTRGQHELRSYISDTYSRIHTYFNIMEHLSTHIQSLNIFLINNNKYDVIIFDSPWSNIYTNHKINMNRIRTLKYSLKGCVFALLAALPVFACMSHESFISIIRGIFLKLWI